MQRTRISFLLTFLIFNFGFAFKSQSQTVTPNTLRMLTLNFNAETDNQDLRKKREVILENYITQNGVQVIYIPECWTIDNKNNAQLLAADLGMDGVYQMENGVAGIWVSSLCMIANKSLHLRNVVYFKLPHSAPSIGNGQTSWVSLGEVNTLIGATITLGNGQTAFLWTAHLNSSSDTYRTDQIKFAGEQMVKMANDNGQDWNTAWTIFGGDFNTTPETPGIQYLINQLGFKDSWPIAQPGDAGSTFASDPTLPDYNPMTHGAGLFPSQAGYQEPGRFDYLLVHGGGGVNFSAGDTRVFTSPVNGVWMSDHFGLTAEFDFRGAPVPGFPSADTDMASLGEPTILAITDASLKTLPSTQDFDVTSPRGFTLTDTPDVGVLFSFTGNKSNVYPTSHATLGKGDIISFAFFSCGEYPYQLETIIDPATTTHTMTGTITVR